MSMINKNGTINWKDNEHLTYILYSVMKNYMIKNNLTYWPCHGKDSGVIECAKIMSIVIGVEVSPDTIGHHLWIQTDKPGIPASKFKRIRIAMEVGLLSKDNYSGVVIKGISRVEEKKHIIS